MTDSDVSDLRGILKRQSAKPNRGATVCRALIILATIILLSSSLSFLVGPSATEGSQEQSRDIVVRVAATGTAPTFRIFLPADISSNKGDNVSFTIYVQDVDDDTINVTWDFGDGSPFEVNTTAPASMTQIVRTSHIYNPYCPGQGAYFPFDGPFTVNYSINVTLDDGNGNGVWRNTTKVHVNLPENSPPATPTVSGPTQKVDPMDPVVITANSSDPEGDELWWTYFFNDSVTDANYFVKKNHTSRTAPGVNVFTNQSVVLGVEGNFTVKVYVCDAPIPYQRFPHNLSDSFGPFEAIFNRVPIATDVISASPPSPVINATIGYVEVVYSIDAFDQDGDVLNLTWNFGDGTDNVTNLSAGGDSRYRFEQVRNYTEPGFFNITLLVTDGRVGHEVLRNLTISVQSTNRPPNLKNFSYSYRTGNFALPNETLNFTLTIFDDERDPIEVIVDWGDNSTWEYYNLTAFVDKNVTLLLNHTYVEVGKYNITIWYTDHKLGVFNHSKMLTNLVKVQVPLPPVHHYWSWWDYTSLGLFCMIPVVITARFFQISRQRKKLELEGLTLEEWKLMKSEMGTDLVKKEGP